MKAIILAAGRGSRMGALTQDKPKCLIRFREKMLIEWQLSALMTAGIDDIAIVGGYKAEMLKQFTTQNFLNPRWAETNMVSSFLCAKEYLETDTCIISYSDIVYSPGAVKMLINSPGDIAITYDPNWLHLWQNRFDDPLSDAETFQLDQEGFLKEIGARAKTIEEVQGQYMGLLKISPVGFLKIQKYLHTISAAEIDKLSMTELLSKLINLEKIYTVSISDKWCELDSKDDLLACEDMTFLK